MRIVKLTLITIGVLFFGMLVLWWNIGPQPFTYLSYVIETQKTKDEITVSAACGNTNFKVLHTDEAYMGRFGFIDTSTTYPGITQKYYLQGLIDNRQVFSELNTFEYPETFSADRIPTVDSIDKAFVVDSSAFSKIENAGASGGGGGFNARVLSFPATAVSDNDLSSVADCFSKHAKELNEASHWPVAAFIKMKGSSRAQNFATYDEFRCSDGHKITLDSNFARLDGQTYNIIGILNLHGYLRAWTGQGTSYADMGMSNPIGERADISRWQSCRDASGQTFGEYVNQTGQKLKVLQN